MELYGMKEKLGEKKKEGRFSVFEEEIVQNTESKKSIVGFGKTKQSAECRKLENEKK